jgi:hypothetical protein
MYQTMRMIAETPELFPKRKILRLQLSAIVSLRNLCLRENKAYASTIVNILVNINETLLQRPKSEPHQSGAYDHKSLRRLTDVMLDLCCSDPPCLWKIFCISCRCWLSGGCGASWEPRSHAESNQWPIQVASSGLQVNRTLNDNKLMVDGCSSRQIMTIS